jgi:riboflavin biosynthesis pyrimidine reductase
LLLEKISTRFDVRTLMLEGGGGINGSLLQAGLIDEVSVLIAPVADGHMGEATVFDVSATHFTPQRLALEEVERRSDVLWLRYRVVAS